MNLADIRLAASIEFGIRADTAGEKQTMVDRLANAAVLEILKRTKIRVTSATVSTTPDVGDYDVPMEVLRLTGLAGPASAGTTSKPIKRVDPEEISWRRSNPSSSSQSTAARYAIDGFNLLMLDPTPASIYTLIMYYVPRPAKMTGPTDDPSTIAFGGIPEEFHETVLLPFVYWRGGSAGDDQTSAQGARYQQDFEAGLKDMRVRINRRGGRLSRAKTIYNQRRRVWAPDQA